MARQSDSLMQVIINGTAHEQRDAKGRAGPAAEPAHFHTLQIEHMMLKMQ